MAATLRDSGEAGTCAGAEGLRPQRRRGSRGGAVPQIPLEAHGRTSSAPRKSSLSLRYGALDALAHVMVDSTRVRGRHFSRSPQRRRLDSGEGERPLPACSSAIEQQYNALDAAALRAAAASAGANLDFDRCSRALEQRGAGFAEATPSGMEAAVKGGVPGLSTCDDLTRSAHNTETVTAALKQGSAAAVLLVSPRMVAASEVLQDPISAGADTAARRRKDSSRCGGCVLIASSVLARIDGWLARWR